MQKSETNFLPSPDNIILESVKMLEKLFTASKARQILHDASVRSTCRLSKSPVCHCDVAAVGGLPPYGCGHSACRSPLKGSRNLLIIFGEFETSCTRLPRRFAPRNDMQGSFLTSSDSCLNILIKNPYQLTMTRAPSLRSTRRVVFGATSPRMMRRASSVSTVCCR